MKYMLKAIIIKIQEHKILTRHLLGFYYTANYTAKVKVTTKKSIRTKLERISKKENASGFFTTKSKFKIYDSNRWPSS